MKNKRLKAFTLLEMTITMLISAILIGLTFTIYSIVTRSYNTFISKNDEMTTFVLLDKLLKRDVNKAEAVIKTPEGITTTGPRDTVRYEFRDSLVIRTMGITDTFRVNYQDLVLKFGHLPLREPGADTPVLLDEVSFTISYHGQNIPFYYKKTYSAENLLNLTSHAIN